MRYLFLLISFVSFVSCSPNFKQGLKAVATSTFTNRNVYKTKSNLTVKKIYHNGRPATDIREFTIVPNPGIPIVTRTTITTTTVPGPPSQTTTRTDVTTIPPTTVTSNSVAVPVTPPATVSTTSSVTTYSVPGALPSTDYIRYKVLSDDGDFKYIRVLPGCHFAGAPPTDTSIVFGNTLNPDEPEDYVFQVSKKALTPNTHYLASSALIGKLITIPLRVRKEYWNNNNVVLQGAFSLGYGFGWKIKIKNNPYQPHYISLIPYAAGISQQKYFFIAGKYQGTAKDSVSAKTDEIAVTYLSLGAAYEFDKFHIGIFFGKDRMFGNLKNWRYQDKWWWGVGIGYDLFK